MSVRAQADRQHDDSSGTVTTQRPAPRIERLRIRNLTKQFGDLAALRDFDLEVQGGEFISLLGPSGCGKTTALNCIAGLLVPVSYTHLRAHETDSYLVCRLLLE